MGSNQVVKPDLLLFHGFWGQAADWDFLKGKLVQSFQSISYTKDPLLGPENFLSDWGQNFLKWKIEKNLSPKITAVGYSQGGRLLLQAFALAPEIFEKLILISTHPGMTDFAEREQRLLNDRKWAKKFRTEDLINLEKEWNAQAVFEGKPSPPKELADSERETLSHCLENWSLAHQANFRDLMNAHSDKIRFILGKEDTKYIKLYQFFLRDLSILKMEKGAAHRVPFDQPDSVVETLNLILK